MLHHYQVVHLLLVLHCLWECEFYKIDIPGIVRASTIIKTSHNKQNVSSTFPPKEKKMNQDFLIK